MSCASLSVVICAHNPHRERFQLTLESLKAQTLPAAEWELIVVDNSSSQPLADSFDWTWHPAPKHVVERKLGLVHARVAGTKSATSPWCISVDDDTPLAVNYLEAAARIVRQYPSLGIFGGRSKGVYESPPPEWLGEFERLLAIQDRGDEVLITKGTQHPREYPANSPILIAYSRQAFLQCYARQYEQSTASQGLGRKGNNLASGEDNDIVMSILRGGYDVGYFPELQFQHLIPEKRCRADYLGRLLRASGRTWVAVLDLHGINPYPPIHPVTLPLRKLRSALRLKPWTSTAARLHWESSCGNLEGRADSWSRQRERNSQ